MKIFVISQNDAGQRLDKFLRKTAPNLPQSLLYKAIRKKDIKINRKRAEISERSSGAPFYRGRSGAAGKRAVFRFRTFTWRIA